ncbi:helix-turn-helix domain containing protein [Brevirhabdus pacifica]|uniref:Helix-turn-helix domain containing protein n=2 Tax=Brevirhabdus pacifica TaxID=1267768 RepID=A0A1U7DLW4_9RHOB|nr:DUF6456 domain-containing protein [Brevirhabdus pacifica]APX90905.1 helix-turn-helix domain containing protein [Brevirhabdus pacifica]OWU80345.1 hypothetical protein ATO5_02490 [Loktanella sp. 22II-4b]
MTGGGRALRLPDWVPEDVRLYLLHVEAGASLRGLARGRRVHASTVLRQVRRCETRRDDPLFDQALNEIGQACGRVPSAPRGHGISHEKNIEESAPMTTMIRSTTSLDQDTIEREARRILRRLCETGASLVVSPGLAKAVVLRRTEPDQDPVRTAVLDNEVARAFAVKEWIACAAKGRIARYEITTVGRAALKRLLAQARGGRAEGTPPPDDKAGVDGAEGIQPFADQHRDWAPEDHSGPIPAAGQAPRRARYNLAESPLLALSRRRDAKTGQAFLPPELVRAGERLREDFELAQMGPRVAQNWDRFLSGGDRGAYGAGGAGHGPQAARDRVMAALSALGPGLGDILLRCCCFLEGLEAAEKRMGWSARSGKVVLRIALQQLHAHYDSLPEGNSRLIG